MTARIDRVVSDVVATPEPAAAGEQSTEDRWEREEKLRAMLRRCREEEERVRAGGFDD